MRVDTDGTEQDIVFLIDNGGDICHNSYIVMANDAQRDGVLFAVAFPSPTRLYDTVGETWLQLPCVRTVGTVYFDSSADGYKSEYIIAIDRVTAFG